MEPGDKNQRVYAPEPGLIYPESSVPAIWVREYFLWFVNRREYYLQNSYASESDYQKPSYFRVKKYLLGDGQVIRHLCGIHTIGLYAIDPETNSCKWFCLDLDYEDADSDLAAIEAAMRDDGLAPAFEHSRRGGHIWLLCNEPIPARQGRIYLYNLLDGLGIAVRGRAGNKEGVEIFPKQDSLEKGEFGNGVRGPLGIHRKTKLRYWFRDAETNLKAQFSYLRSLPRLTRSRLEELTLGMSMPEDLMPEINEPPKWEKPVSVFEKFDIRLYTSSPRSSKRDYFTRCPSCAEAGRDTSGDNLHITHISAGPPLFICFAGCTFRDITEACYRKYGRPEPRKF